MASLPPDASVTISGAVTGTGGIIPSVAGSNTLTLSSLSNTFTGPIPGTPPSSLLPSPPKDSFLTR